MVQQIEEDFCDKMLREMQEYQRQREESAAAEAQTKAVQDRKIAIVSAAADVVTRRYDAVKEQLTKNIEKSAQRAAMEIRALGNNPALMQQLQRRVAQQEARRERSVSRRR